MVVVKFMKQCGNLLGTTEAYSEVSVCLQKTETLDLQETYNN